MTAKVLNKHRKKTGVLPHCLVKCMVSLLDRGEGNIITYGKLSGVRSFFSSVAGEGRNGTTNNCLF